LANLGPGIIFTDDTNVVPDVVWISRERLKTALWEDGKLHSCPELVVEVLSPGSTNERRDREVKLKLYSRRGAEEYWIANWQEQRLEVYRRQEGILELDKTLGEADTLQSPILPGFRCKVGQFFTRVLR
jgi:Uma2 family endonuclease